MTTTTTETAPPSSEAGLSVPELAESVDSRAAHYLLSPDPEDIHQIRVATRRLRATLKIRGGDAATALADEVKWLTDAVSSTRDADVLVETVNGTINKRGDEFASSLAPLTLALRNTSNLLRGRATRSLRSARFKKLLEDLRDRPLAAGHALNGNSASHPAAVSMAAEISKRRKKLHTAAKSFFSAGDAESLHNARIAAKKLRYSLEVANASRDSKFVTRQVSGLRAFQDELGLAHDLHVAADRVSELAQRNAEKWSEETLSSVKTLRKDLLRQADKRIAAAPRRYRKIRGDDPQALLRKVLRKLEL